MSESEEKIVKKRGRPKKTTEQMIVENSEIVKEIVLTQNDKIINALECAKQEYDKSKNAVEVSIKRAMQVGDKIMNMAERAFEYAKQGDDVFDAFIKAGSSFMKDFVSRYGKDIGILHNQLFVMNKIYMYATKDLEIGDIMFDYSSKMKLEAFFVISYFPEENILHFYQNEIKTTDKWYCFAKIPS